jgi:hypothetical protein
MFEACKMVRETSLLAVGKIEAQRPLDFVAQQVRHASQSLC